MTTFKIITKWAIDDKHNHRNFDRCNYFGSDERQLIIGEHPET